MTASTIIKEVAAAHGVSVDDVRSRKRTARLFLVRAIIAGRLRREAGLSAPTIGRLLNRSKDSAQYYLLPKTRAGRRLRATAYMQARKAA